MNYFPLKVHMKGNLSVSYINGFRKSNYLNIGLKRDHEM